MEKKTNWLHIGEEKSTYIFGLGISKHANLT